MWNVRTQKRAIGGKGAELRVKWIILCRRGAAAAADRKYLVPSRERGVILGPRSGVPESPAGARISRLGESALRAGIYELAPAARRLHGTPAPARTDKPAFLRRPYGKLLHAVTNPSSYNKITTILFFFR